jgi:tetratricopeptide (TPR) repeat protein
MQQTALLQDLANRAREAMAAGQFDAAQRIWQQVLTSAPEQPQALFNLGQIAMQRQDAAAAGQYFQRAARAAPQDPLIALNLSFACRAQNDDAGEMAALTSALVIDPYFFPALLAKGRLQERTGHVRLAAKTYKDVLLILPPEDQIPVGMKASIDHAREVVAQNAAALDAHLNSLLADARARHDNADLARFDQCQDVTTGRKKIYTQQPTLLYYPALPAIQYYDRKDFPWLFEFEAQTPAIRGELETMMREEAEKFRPYIDHPAESPSRQWLELNHSERWSVFFLWKDGEKVEDACVRCPNTAAVVEKLPLVRIPNFGPTVMFSALSPRTHIPPHTSVTNTRLIVHLPIIVPPNCRFRVGNETREWKEGQAWVFDDTIDHEAWNDSDELRVILMLDIWNPYLSEAERDLVGGLVNGVRDYYAR